MKYDGTLIVVSHDRDFLGELNNRTIEFRDKKLYEYLGDINFFLDKRAMDNMREVEMATKQKAKAKGNKKTTQAEEKRVLTHEERKELKRLERKVKNAEREIENLEAKIVTFEKDMGVDGFYESTDSNKVLEAYNETKQKLSKAMETWEKATMDLDAFE